MTERSDRSQESLALEAKMTPEERALFESFKSRIGQEYEPRHGHEMFMPLFSEDPVTLHRIKMWAKVCGDANPLYSDDKYAASSHWGGIVAPPLFLLTVNDGVTTCAFFVKDVFTPAPNCVLNRARYPNLRGVMQTSTEWEFFAPVRPGDRITTKGRLTDLYWKGGAKFRLLFAYGETDYINQGLQRVACCRGGAVYMFKQIG